MPKRLERGPGGKSCCQLIEADLAVLRLGCLFVGCAIHGFFFTVPKLTEESNGGLKGSERNSFPTHVC